ncbi:MAG: hypothetical protein QXT43_00555 [Candidatus Micrarchaeaceae archaeon]
MKAQFWSFDVIFAMVIFGTALVLLTFVWFSVSEQFSLASGNGVEELQAQLGLLQSQILAPGTPADWNSFLNITKPSTWNNVSIGLGSGNGNNVSIAKTMALMGLANYNNTAYQASKQMLGIGYDYFISIKGSAFNITIGRSPYANKAVAIESASMPVVIQGQQANMQILVWTNTTFGVG